MALAQLIETDALAAFGCLYDSQKGPWCRRPNERTNAGSRMKKQRNKMLHWAVAANHAW